MNKYIGHQSQLYGVEEHILANGKGKGMRILEVRNKTGLELSITIDRCADISRLRINGLNVGYFSPCGYVAPSYYDSSDDNFLKSFTAGFLTTCGLENVGVPTTDKGEKLPLHGSISNTPAENYGHYIQNNQIIVYAEIHDETIFARKLTLFRKFIIELDKNEFYIEDTITNTGDTLTPLEIMYHMNIGYPMLDEDSVLKISSDSVIPRDADAEEGKENWNIIDTPTPNYKEKCYYHNCINDGIASIYQPKNNIGLKIEFDPKSLDFLTQWKMMGVRDYVLGIEPGNCNPEGRDKIRSSGRLKFIEPTESIEYKLKISTFK